MPESRFSISRRYGFPIELSRLRVETVRLWLEFVLLNETLEFGLTWEDRCCFPPDFTGGSETSIATTSLPLPKVIVDFAGVEWDILALISIMGVWRVGGKETGTGGIRSVIQGGGSTHAGIGGTGGAFDSSGNATVRGVMRERGSEILFESLCSTGDLIAMMLVREMGELLKLIGDAGAEDTRLIVLVCGKIVIPHLLAGRRGAGLNRAGVIGEFASAGEEEEGGRIVTSACSR